MSTLSAEGGLPRASKLESQRDDEGYELRPVYGCSRGDLEEDPAEPIGWSKDARGAAKIINKYISEVLGDDTRLKASELFFSRHLQAWFTEE